MRILKQVLTAVGALLLTGLIAVTLAQAMSGKTATKTATNNRATAVQTETAAFFAASTPFTTALPDIRYIPVYTDSAAIRVESTPYLNGYSFAQLTYAAGVGSLKVQEFYDHALSQHGWRLVSYHFPMTTYLWTDPGGRLPWHLTLDVLMTEAQEGRTEVTLTYERLPDVEANLPLYAGAQQVEQKESKDSVDTYIGQQLVRDPIRVITKTFLSTATLEQLEHFYNSTLPDYGWAFFDKNRSMDNGGPQMVDK